MATKLSLASATLRTNLARLAAALTLAAALAPGCGDSHPSDPAAPIARALSEPNWAPGVTYQMGALVQYQGIVYECRQLHTSAVGWEPPGQYSLWQRPTPTDPGPTPWYPQVHYVVGSDVSYNGSLWECLQEHVSQPDWAPSQYTVSLWRKVGTGSGACTGLPDGSLCDDGKSCNVDTCQAGVCVGTAATCGGTILETTDPVGSTGGAFTVTAAGRASYAIPLWTPEGRNGMEPNLAISYASDAPDSVVGQGWSLDGAASLINRCVADTRADGKPSGVTAVSNEFCLDGRRLVLIGGTPGKANAEYRTQPDSFTKIVIDASDGAGPLQFSVYSRDGRIQTYGSLTGDPLLQIQTNADNWIVDDTSRADSAVKQNPVVVSPRLAWLRASVSDRSQNRIWFKYTNAGSATVAQEPLVDLIEYVDVNGFRTRTIKFTYVNRIDAKANRLLNVAGVHFGLTKILQSIDMRVAAPDTTTLKSVKFYKFTQGTSVTTHRPRLDSIQECDGNSATVTGRTVKCKQATTFTYEPGTESYVQVNLGLPPQTAVTYSAVYVGDVNNDGRGDVIYRSKPTSPPGEPSHWYAQLAQGTGTSVSFLPAQDLNLENNDQTGDPLVYDFNHDGYVDIAVPSGPQSYAFYLNQQGGNTPTFSKIADDGGAVSSGAQIGDFSGRGQLSILRPSGPAGQSSWGYSYFKRDCVEGFCDASLPTFSGALPVVFESNKLAGWNTYTIDVDGNHAQDLLSRGGSSVNHLVSISQVKVPGSDPLQASDWSTPAQTTLLASTPTNLVKYLFLDQNGDGLMDAVRFRQGEATPALIMNSGNGYAPPQMLTGLGVGNIALGTGTNYKDLKDVGARVLDYDRDGKSDILLVDNGAKRDSTATTNNPTRSNLVVLLSRGTSFEVHPLDGQGGRPLISLGQFGDGATPPDSTKVHNYRGTQVLDANGDGLPDILMFNAQGQPLLWTREGNRADLLIGVTDGMGKKIAVTYKPMSDTSVYTQGAVCVAPIKCGTGTDLLVSNHFEDNGIGNAQNEFVYTYKHLGYDLEGGGLLGFAERTIEDKAKRSVVQETFDMTLDDVRDDTGTLLFQFYGRTGMPKKRVTTVTGTGFTRAVTREFFYEVVTTNGTRTFYTRPTLQIVHTVDSGLSGKDISTEQTRYDYDPALTNYGLSSGGSTDHSVFDQKTGTLKSFRHSWFSTFENYPNVVPNVTPQPWLIGLRTREVHCSSSFPADQTDATLDNCKNPGVALARRERKFTNNLATGAMLTMEIQPQGNTDERSTITYTRSPQYGVLTGVTRKAGDSTLPSRTDTISYDKQSVFHAGYTNALGHKTTLNIDAGLGVLLSTSDPNGATTTFDYDAFGRLRRANPPGGGGRTVTYARDTTDPTLTVVTNRVDGGGESRVFINRLGQQVRTEDKLIDGRFRYVKQGYNALGLRTSVTRPAIVGTNGAATTWQFDEIGRMRSMIRPEEAVDDAGDFVSSATASGSYSGLVSTMTDDGGRLTRYTADAMGRVAQSEAQNDSGEWISTEYTYGHFGVLDAVTVRDGKKLPANGRKTVFGYDALGRQITVTSPDAGTRNRLYNGFGDVRQEWDGENLITTFELDDLGRVKSKTNKDGTTTYTWDTASNGLGKLASSVGPAPDNVKQEYFYDSFGRTFRETTTVGTQKFTVDYAFDPVSGRISQVSYPTTPSFPRLVVNKSYEPNAGRMSKVQAQGGAGPYWSLLETEIDGQIHKEVYGNGVTNVSEHSLVTGRLHKITTLSTPLRSWAYSYLADGNLHRRTDLAATPALHERFTYDKLNRLLGWMDADDKGNKKPGGWEVNYELDDFGSIKHRKFAPATGSGASPQDIEYTLSADSQRVVSAFGGTYGYDGNGNQTKRPGDGTNDEIVTYTTFDLPKTVTGPRAATFTYDADGRRVKKQQTATGAYTIYIGNLYEKRVSGPGAGATVQHVFYVGNAEGPVAQVIRTEGGTEETLYLHGDRLGSVDAVTNSSGGLMASESVPRDPYGNRVSDRNQPTLTMPGGSGVGNMHLGFTGHEQDDDLGMVNMRGRMFDPRLGRFVTPDPLGGGLLDGQSLNKYAYVTNNPTAFVDPSGLVPNGRYTKIVNPSKELPLEPGQGYVCSPDDVAESEVQTYTCIVSGQIIGDTPPVGPAGTDGDGSNTGSGDTGGGGGGMMPVGIIGPQQTVVVVVPPEDCVKHCRFEQFKPDMDQILDMEGYIPTEDLYHAFAEFRHDMADTAWDEGDIATAVFSEALERFYDAVDRVGGLEGVVEQGWRGLLEQVVEGVVEDFGLSDGPPPQLGSGDDLHGNDLNTTKPAEGYSLREIGTGKVLKYGETTRHERRYTKDYLREHNARIQWEAKGTKREMHQWQHMKILQYKAGHGGNRPPLNKCDY